MFRRLIALACTVALGLASRLRPLGWPLYDHSLGDALYAVAAYLAVSLLRPRWAPHRVAAVSLAVCLALEAFQATGIPARYADRLVVRWLIGTTFSWHDVLCYVAGVLGIALLDATLLRPRPGLGESGLPEGR
jgi:hypothetical protein